MEQVGRGDIGLHLAAVVGPQFGLVPQQVAIAADDFLVLGVPNDELVVRTRHEVHIIDIHFLACSTSAVTITDLTQTCYLAHDVGSVVCGNVVDKVARLVGWTQEVALQFVLQDLAVNSRNYCLHRQFVLHIQPTLSGCVTRRKWYMG